MDDDITVLADPAVWAGTGGVKSSKLRSRTSRSGRVGFYVEVQSEPVVTSFDPKTMGRAVAVAMANALKAKMRAITAGVSARTLEYREEALAGFVRGARWATRRYSGGRTGGRQPAQSDRAFNDSGRFADSIAVGAADDAWRINVAANRLDPSTTSGELGVRRIWTKLVQLVPEFGKPLMLFSEIGVRDAVKQSLEGMIVKAELRRTELTRAAAAAKVQAARQILQALLQIAA